MRRRIVVRTWSGALVWCKWVRYKRVYAPFVFTVVYIFLYLSSWQAFLSYIVP